jgi:hypothetical protein
MTASSHLRNGSQSCLEADSHDTFLNPCCSGSVLLAPCLQPGNNGSSMSLCLSLIATGRSTEHPGCPWYKVFDPGLSF